MGGKEMLIPGQGSGTLRAFINAGNKKPALEREGQLFRG